MAVSYKESEAGYSSDGERTGIVLKHLSQDMSNKIERPILRYFGGKWRLAPWIIDQLPEHEIYAEPFGGGASVLLRKPRSKAEVYNDLDDSVVNVFRVYQDAEKAAILREKLRLTPFARRELEVAQMECADDIERARRTIVRSFFGFASQPARMNPGFRACATKQNTTPATDWQNYIPASAAFTERLAGVTIENNDAIKMIPQFDTLTTLFYVDPPYVLETRRETESYKFEFSIEDHDRLVSALKEAKGMVLLSGYEHRVYEKLGWSSRTAASYANGQSSEDRKRTEVLWLNPAAERALAQQRLF